MSLPKHLDEAGSRMRDALARIRAARAQPTSLESLRDWMAALTDYSVALSDVQTFSNESVHEKLHELAERARVRTVAPGGGARRAAR